MKGLIALCLILILQSCGKLAEMKKSASDFSGLGTPDSGPLTGPESFTPGSYFLQLKDVGSSKDVRIYEFQYLSDKTFIMTVTNFSGGTLASGLYHKKTGTYSDVGGIITHTVLTDSCNDLSPVVVSVAGDKKTSVTAVVGGTTMTLFSYATYFLPSAVTAQLPLATEDIGCLKFR